ncbi:hypothetical protein [Candidatus Villigracilis affinis]|uniref:hypothetical protein n=1 Tax=Candidatus Villigracilis affinis TaxID=3140682 RepID=UPI002A22548F|nr:hypothetical protein [Anaerolineales bacterium]
MGKQIQMHQFKYKFEVVSSKIKENLYLNNPNESLMYQYQSNVADLDSFSMQRRLGKQLNAFAEFISGLYFFQNTKYDEAISIFDKSLELDEWAQELVGKQVLYYYRGSSYLYSQEFEKAIDDYTEA